jgi:hypothetical protein
VGSTCSSSRYRCCLLLKYDGYFLWYFLSSIALATVSFPRHYTILARRSFRRPTYSFLLRVSTTVSPSVSPTVRRHYITTLFRVQNSRVQVSVEESGPKRRTVVYITPFLSLLSYQSDQYNLATDPSVNTRRPLIWQISSRTFVSSATPKTHSVQHL